MKRTTIIHNPIRTNRKQNTRQATRPPWGESTSAPGSFFNNLCCLSWSMICLPACLLAARRNDKQVLSTLRMDSISILICLVADKIAWCPVPKSRRRPAMPRRTSSLRLDATNLVRRRPFVPSWAMLIVADVLKKSLCLRVSNERLAKTQCHIWKKDKPAKQRLACEQI